MILIELIVIMTSRSIEYRINNWLAIVVHEHRKLVFMERRAEQQNMLEYVLIFSFCIAV